MCPHLKQVSTPRASSLRPSSHGCQECLAAGGSWVHLRLCMTCGHVGCCDNSPSRHATHHFHGTHHPVAKSFEPGEDWAWCYVDEEMVDAVPAFPAESPARHYSPGSELSR